jgi:chemosensory pili system protein ChpA (sensor histidine kinase/response regulator)
MSKPIALIIEDDPQIGDILSISLRNEFKTELMQDGNEALERLAEIVPALIMLDLNLPAVSGKDIFAQISSDARFKNTRVILCTADALQAESLRHQADLVLLKPVSPSQVRELASRMVNNS